MGSEGTALALAAGAAGVGFVYYFYFRKSGEVARLRRQLSTCAQAAQKKYAAAIKPPVGHYGYPELPTPPLPKILTFEQEETPKWFEQEVGLSLPQILPQTRSF